MPLKTALPRYSLQVNRTLTQFFRTQEKIAKGIDDSLTDSLAMLSAFSLRGGKAVRPFLASLSYALAGGEPRSGLIKATSALDLHHKHILILDDIADRDEKRYGGLTLEWAYRREFSQLKERDHRALSFAMLDAVWLGALARELLFASGFESEKLIQVSKILNTLMFRDTLAGWKIHALECDRSFKQVTPEEFIKGLNLVTARYTFEGPLKIGLILAGNKDRNLEKALTTYAQAVGTAFQIQDDILGLFGESEKTGKPVGNDLREGKKTLLVQMAYQNGSSTQKKLLEQAVGQRSLSRNQVRQIQTIVRETEALTASQTLATQMVQAGNTALEPLPASPTKTLLMELANYVISREK